MAGKVQGNFKAARNSFKVRSGFFAKRVRMAC